jgi:hypothetical protein
MKRAYHVLSLGVIFIGLAVISGICWHSVEEIHYLKSFFPKQFTVQEAYYASKIEIIKVLIICIPVVVIIVVTLYILRYYEKDS